MTKETVIGIVLALCIAIGGVMFIFYKNGGLSTNSPANTTSETNTNNSKVNSTGIVSILERIPNPNNAENTTQTSTEQQDTSTTSDEATLTISIPEDWKPKEDTEEVKSCNPELRAATKSYVIASVTITIFENSSPAGCDNKTIGDVNVSFSYGDDGVLKLQKRDKYEQCTKAQNSTCPKGDGKVTVFVTSVDEDSKENKNPLNNNTYAFRIVDTDIDADFNKQVDGLVNLIGKITFQYE